MLRVDADPGVLHGHQHSIIPVGPRANDDLARPVLNRRHRLDGIDDEIEDHLLQLNPVGDHRRQLGRQVEAQRHVVQPQLRAHDGQHVEDDAIDVRRRLPGRALRRELADALNHLGRPLALRHDPLQRTPHTFEVRARRSQPVQGGIGIGHDGAERLVHLVGDRRHQLP